MPIDSTCHGRRMLRNFLDTAAAARRLPERRTEVIENGIHRMLLLAEIDAGRRGGVPAPHDPRIRKVVRLIDEDPAARRSVGDLAALAHLSPSRFAHVFRDEVGIGPKRYLEGRRLARAGDLLLTTDRTVEQIARDVGFESPEHFSTRFRAVIGVPPREYRKRPTRVDPPSGDVG